MTKVTQETSIFVAFPAIMLYVPMRTPYFLIDESLDPLIRENYHSVYTYCRDVAPHMKPIPSVATNEDSSPTHYIFGFELDFEDTILLQEFATENGFNFRTFRTFDFSAPLTDTDVVYMPISKCKQFQKVNPTFAIVE